MNTEKEQTINQFFFDGNVCPNCKAAFKIVYSNSQFYACTQCMAYLDIRDRGKIKKTASSNKKFNPSLPLGSKGVIGGISYQVIAYTRCRERKSIYHWNEYYLYSREGFAYLSEYDGHWIFLTHPITSPGNKYNGQTLTHEGRNYQLYNSYVSEITYLEGEFDHDVVYGEKKGTYEYIHPPYMLSCEREGQQVKNWIQGEHIENSEIAKLFSVSIPGRSGVGMVQPLSKSYTILGLWKILMIGLLGLLLTHILVNSLKPSYKVVFEQTYTLSDTSGAIPSAVATAPFTIPEGILSTDNLEIMLECPVSNTWFETRISLINDKTGEEFNVETGVEYYLGADYSEGGQLKTITLSEIPAGTYHMNIFPAQDTSTYVPYKPTWYRIKLTRGVEMLSNLFIIIICMMIFPLIQFYRYRSMESQRWENSNYG